VRRIYIASSWRMAAAVGDMAQVLRLAGHEVFDFTDGDNRPDGMDHFRFDVRELEADRLVSVMEKFYEALILNSEIAAKEAEHQVLSTIGKAVENKKSSDGNGEKTEAKPLDPRDQGVMYG